MNVTVLSPMASPGRNAATARLTIENRMTKIRERRAIKGNIGVTEGINTLQI